MLLTEKLTMPFENIPVSHKVWWKCDYCGVEFQREIKVINRANKNSTTHSCGSKPCKKKKKEDGCLSKYGVTHVSKVTEVVEKRISKIKAKMPETIKKMKQTNVERYGTEYASQNDQVKEKMKNTNLSRYGTECSLQNDVVQEKTKKTNIDKFGVEFPIQKVEVQNKRIQTNLERFGVEHASQSDVVKNKIIETNLQNHGVPYSGMRDDVKEKICQTNMERYGVQNPLQNDEINKKRKQTNLERYGHESAFGNDEIKNKIKDTNIERYGFQKASQNPSVIEKMIDTNMAKYGVPAACMLSENKNYGKTQKEIAEWLLSLGFEFAANYEILHGKELDLYNKNLNLAIEYCGLYWHHELSPEPRTRSYHYNKYKLCNQKGVRLITIFEDEWIKKQSQCKNFIRSILNKNQTKIFARKCEIKQIEKDTLQNFCQKYHIQGSNNLAIICYGLFYQNELVGAMSFGKHHRNSKDLTLDRLCFKDDTTVIGGSSKLFRACCNWAKAEGFTQVVSWSDNRWSVGCVYEKLGFKLAIEGKPDYSYVDLNHKHSRKSKQSQRKLVPSIQTERQICLEKGLVRIWDCGKKKWIYDIK